MDVPDEVLAYRRTRQDAVAARGWQLRLRRDHAEHEMGRRICRNDILVHIAVC